MCTEELEDRPEQDGDPSPPESPSPPVGRDLRPRRPAVEASPPAPAANVSLARPAKRRRIQASNLSAEVIEDSDGEANCGHGRVEVLIERPAGQSDPGFHLPLHLLNAAELELVERMCRYGRHWPDQARTDAVARAIEAMGAVVTRTPGTVPVCTSDSKSLIDFD